MDLEDVQKNWEEFGETNPLWAVLTNNGAWDPEEFFGTGRASVEAVLAHLAARSIEVPKGTVLDFGCGVGRLSRALSAHFERVVGVDIASSMVELARKLNEDFSGCEFVLNQRGDMSQFDDASLEVVFSLITLQHVEPRYSKAYLADFVRLLKPGGLLIFQLPAKKLEKPKKLGRSIERGLKELIPSSLREKWRERKEKARKNPKMETYAVPRPEIEALLTETGCELLDVVEDDAAGRRFLGYRYTARKRG